MPKPQRAKSNSGYHRGIGKDALARYGFEMQTVGYCPQCKVKGRNDFCVPAKKIGENCKYTDTYLLIDRLINSEYMATVAFVGHGKCFQYPDDAMKFFIERNRNATQ